MDGLLYASIVILLIIASGLTYEHFNTKKVLREIYIGRMVGFIEGQYHINGAVLSFNDKEVIVSTWEGLYKTTPNNIYFVD